MELQTLRVSSPVTPHQVSCSCSYVPQFQSMYFQPILYSTSIHYDENRAHQESYSLRGYVLACYQRRNKPDHEQKERSSHTDRFIAATWRVHGFTRFLSLSALLRPRSPSTTTTSIPPSTPKPQKATYRPHQPRPRRSDDWTLRRRHKHTFSCLPGSLQYARLCSAHLVSIPGGRQRTRRRRCIVWDVDRCAILVINSQDRLSFSLHLVFTKCKQSLKDGRRLENISWRLWFREISYSHSPNSGTSSPALSDAGCPSPITPVSENGPQDG